MSEAIAASSQHASLDKAFLAAQSDFPEIPKDKENTHFKQRYSSLDAIKTATRPALNRNGIITVERTEQMDGRLTVTAILRHVATGQEHTNSASIAEAGTVQGLGSQITYLRRYALAPLLGICSDEDDDGNAGNATSNGRSNPFRDQQREPAEKSQPSKPQTTEALIADIASAAELTTLLTVLVGRHPIGENADRWKQIGLAAKQRLLWSDWTPQQQATVEAVLAGIRNTLKGDVSPPPAAEPQPAAEPLEPKPVAVPKTGDADKAPSLERLAGWIDNLDSPALLKDAFTSIEASDKFADLRANPERMLELLAHAAKLVRQRATAGGWDHEASLLLTDELARLEVRYDLSQQVTEAFQGAP